MRHTILGSAVRAISQDTELGTVQGLPVGLIISGSFVASSILAGVAGILVAQISGTVDPAFGFELVLFGFVAAVLGGMGSSFGALAGGIIEIGRASCRERVCQSVYISVVAVSLNKKTIMI